MCACVRFRRTVFASRFMAAQRVCCRPTCRMLAEELDSAATQQSRTLESPNGEPMLALVADGHEFSAQTQTVKIARLLRFFQFVWPTSRN